MNDCDESKQRQLLMSISERRLFEQKGSRKRWLLQIERFIYNKPCLVPFVSVSSGFSLRRWHGMSYICRLVAIQLPLITHLTDRIVAGAP